MEQIAMRSRARVPAIDCGNTASRARVDRHLAILAGPAVPAAEAEGATLLMQELTSRKPKPERGQPSKTERLSLFAPLRRLRRTLFGNRHH
ncbi:hypothetical protein AB0M28_02275 [Streptomyces sp. NPDC051940]|uniref:hypothetical protein n=1 Tax=Streptomyces sp. NPDC051940 TaxID=3155675 RepID=UPI003440A702